MSVLLYVSGFLIAALFATSGWFVQQAVPDTDDYDFLSNTAFILSAAFVLLTAFIIWIDVAVFIPDQTAALLFVMPFVTAAAVIAETQVQKHDLRFDGVKIWRGVLTTLGFVGGGFSALFGVWTVYLASTKPGHSMTARVLFVAMYGVCLATAVVITGQYSASPDNRYPPREKS